MYVCVCMNVFETLKVLGALLHLWVALAPHVVSSDTMSGQHHYNRVGGASLHQGSGENLDSPLVSFGATLAGQGRSPSFLLLGLKVKNHPRVPLIPWGGVCRSSLKAIKSETLAPYLIFSDSTLVERLVCLITTSQEWQSRLPSQSLFVWVGMGCQFFCGVWLE